MTPEQIKEKYEARILTIMNKIKSELEDEGFVVTDPYEMCDRDDEWWMRVVTGEGRTADDDLEDDDIDIRFIIATSTDWDGTENVVNFMLDVVEVSGRMLGGLIPYNYTDQVWVSRDDEEAIEERFQIMERADPYGVVELLDACH
jgi:hypothetical protein